MGLGAQVLRPVFKISSLEHDASGFRGPLREPRGEDMIHIGMYWVIWERPNPDTEPPHHFQGLLYWGLRFRNYWHSLG